jgi:hypothetical protein
MSTIMNHFKKLTLILAPFLLLGLFLMLTDPYDLPLIILLLPFVLLGWGIFKATKELGKQAGLSQRRSKLTATIVTILVLLTVLLQSIRQLSAKDFIILIVLLAGVTLYVRRFDV